MNPFEKIFDCIVAAFTDEFGVERTKAAIDRALDRAEDYFKDGSVADRIMEGLISSAIRKPFNISDDDAPDDPE